MPEHENSEAPRALHIASWTMVVVGAFVFSSAVGLVAYNMVQNPISAQTEQGASTTEKCTDKETAILNNYPQNPQGGLTGGVDYGKLDNSSGAKWSCSAVCITGYDKSKSWQENESVVRSYLEKSKAGGKNITIYKTYDEFNTALQAGTLTQAQMANTIILSSLDIPAVKDENKGEGGKKARCEGVSQDYVLSQNDKNVSPVAQNNTYAAYQEEQKKQQEEAAAQPSPQPAVGEAKKGAVQVPVGGAPAPASPAPKQEDDYTKYNNLAAACIDKAEKMIRSNSPPTEEQVTFRKKFNDFLTRVTNEVKIAIAKGYRPDRRAQYDKCAKILKELEAKYSETEAGRIAPIPLTQETDLAAIIDLPEITLTVLGSLNRPGAGIIDVSLYTETKGKKSCTRTAYEQNKSTTYILANEATALFKSSEDKAKIFFVYTPAKGGFKNWAKAKLGLSKPAYDFQEFDVSDKYSGNKKAYFNYSPSYKSGNGANYYYLDELYNCGP